jgi:hypothetical protein
LIDTAKARAIAASSARLRGLIGRSCPDKRA